MLEFIPYLFSCAALLLTAYFAFRKEGQEEKQAVAGRLGKLEVEQANQIARQTGFQIEIEGVAEHGKRERQAMAEGIKRDHDTLREQVKDMPDMRQLLARMDERFMNTKEEIKSLAAKLDRVVELLTHK